jgi:hypothetical protein
MVFTYQKLSRLRRSREGRDIPVSALTTCEPCKIDTPPQRPIAKAAGVSPQYFASSLNNGRAIKKAAGVSP